ncbi:MAG: caspase family protein [Nitrospirae bacterium]|nr:MAG: caspase family protein [Nitrospirota bacterium]
MIAAAFASVGCYGERHLVITPNPDSINEAPLPLSVRVEVERFTLNVDPLIPVDLDFREALLSYMNKRRTFREVSDQASEAVFKVKAKLSMLVGHGTRFIYQFAVSAALLTHDKVSIGSYEAEDEAIGGATRFTASADEPPTSLALNRALDSLFAKIEADRAAILARLEGQPTPSPFARPSLPRVPVSDVDRLPSVVASPQRHAYAVVIGIEQYREKLPKADFADRDAKLVGEYLTKVLGYPEENVVVRVNEKATKTDLEKYVEAWLPNNLEKDGSVFIYYSGHGAPNPKSGDAYLVPYDGDPTFVEKTGYPLKRLYAQLEKLPAKHITVVLDSCFSGSGGRSVLAAGAKPMVLSVENAILAGGKTIVLSASAGDQVSSAYQEQGHGLLTYFFLKGLQGDGDLNKDGTIDLAELFEYLKPNVQKIARKQYNNEQTPQLLASPELLKKGGGRLIEAPASSR